MYNTGMYRQNLLDAMAFVSFIVGVANYGENSTQSDKDDIMNRLDQQTKNILLKVQDSLEEQNNMLKDILERLDKIENMDR